MSVRCVVSDGRIWNIEQFLIGVMQEAQQKNRVMVDLNREGPCCGTSGVNAVLDQVVDSMSLDPASIMIFTGNPIVSSAYRELKSGIWKDMKALIDFSIFDLGLSTLRKRFGMFIARSNWKRLGLASHLWRHYRDITALTYHFDPVSDYHRSNFGLEEYLQHNWCDVDIIEFLRVLPLRSDEHVYPIMWNSGLEQLRSQYQDVFCDIVCETYFTGRTFYPTEKTWRPMLYRRPFVVQGPQWYLENLRRLGFQTFGAWWNEGYDEDVNGGSLESLRDVIDFIGSQSKETVQTWYEEMTPVLEHNYQTLCALTQRDIDLAQFRIPE